MTCEMSKIASDNTKRIMSDAELNLIRQWFNAVDDLNPDFLKKEDRELYDKIKELLEKGDHGFVSLKYDNTVVPDGLK